MPSLEKIVSQIIMAGRIPAAARSASAARTPSAKTRPTSIPARTGSGAATVRTWRPSGTSGPSEGENCETASVTP